MLKWCSTIVRRSPECFLIPSECLLRSPECLLRSPGCLQGSPASRSMIRHSSTIQEGKGAAIKMDEAEGYIESLEEVRTKLEDLKKRFKFVEPDRGNLDDASIVWRTEKPDYTRANYQYLKGKTQNHEAGSLEELVENLVKTWECQASHFMDFDQWTTIDHSNYKVQVNGEEELDGKVAYEVGNYNALLPKCPAYHKYGELSFEESHDLFRGAFKGVFPWEVLKVLSGPPYVTFTWRHWGQLDGKFQENQGHGEIVEMYGLIRATVKDQLKIQKLEVHFHLFLFF